MVCCLGPLARNGVIAVARLRATTRAGYSRPPSRCRMRGSSITVRHCSQKKLAMPHVPLSRSANLELALYAAGDAVAQVRAGRSLTDALAGLEPAAGLRARSTGSRLRDTAQPGPARCATGRTAAQARQAGFACPVGLRALPAARAAAHRPYHRGPGGARGVAPRTCGQGPCQRGAAQLSARGGRAACALQLRRRALLLPAVVDRPFARCLAAALGVGAECRQSSPADELARQSASPHCRAVPGQAG